MASKTTPTAKAKPAAAKPKARAAKPKPRAGTAKPAYDTVKGAAQKVLRDAGGPLHYQEIARLVLAGGFNLRRRGGKTFPASVRTELSINPKLFAKVAPGTYRALDDEAAKP